MYSGKIERRYSYQKLEELVRINSYFINFLKIHKLTINYLRSCTVVLNHIVITYVKVQCKRRVIYTIPAGHKNIDFGNTGIMVFYKYNCLKKGWQNEKKKDFINPNSHVQPKLLQSSGVKITHIKFWGSCHTQQPPLMMRCSRPASSFASLAQPLCVALQFSATIQISFCLPWYLQGRSALWGY